MMTFKGKKVRAKEKNIMTITNHKKVKGPEKPRKDGKIGFNTPSDNRDDMYGILEKKVPPLEELLKKEDAEGGLSDDENKRKIKLLGIVTRSMQYLMENNERHAEMMARCKDLINRDKEQ